MFNFEERFLIIPFFYRGISLHFHFLFWLWRFCFFLDWYKNATKNGKLIQCRQLKMAYFLTVTVQSTFRCSREQPSFLKRAKPDVWFSIDEQKVHKKIHDQSFRFSFEQMKFSQFFPILCSVHVSFLGSNVSLRWLKVMFFFLSILSKFIESVVRWPGVDSRSI